MQICIYRRAIHKYSQNMQIWSALQTDNNKKTTLRILIFYIIKFHWCTRIAASLSRTYWLTTTFPSNIENLIKNFDISTRTVELIISIYFSLLILFPYNINFVRKFSVLFSATRYPIFYLVSIFLFSSHSFTRHFTQLRFHCPQIEYKIKSTNNRLSWTIVIAWNRSRIIIFIGIIIIVQLLLLLLLFFPLPRPSSSVCCIHIVENIERLHKIALSKIIRFEFNSKLCLIIFDCNWHFCAS